MRSFWARITGADKGGQRPNQQISYLGGESDVTIIHPYGHYTDLPDDVSTKSLDKSASLPLTEKRPQDVERGEPVSFNPDTFTRIIYRNNGDIEIITAATNGKLLINCGTGDIEAKCGKMLVDGDLEVTGDTSLSDTVTSNGVDISDTHVHDGSPSSPNGPVTPTGTPV